MISQKESAIFNLTWIVTIFMSLLFIQVPLIIISIGFCDAGHYLTLQQELVQFGALRGHAAMTLISDLAGGLWLKAVREHGFIWVKIGGALLNGLNAVVCFSVLRRYYGASRTVLAIFLSSALIAYLAPYDLFINYYTFPAFIGAIIIFAINQCIITTKSNNRKKWAFAAGLLIGILPFSRLPLLPLTVLSLICGIAGWILIKKAQNKELRQALAFGTLGIILGCLVVIGGLFYFSLLSDFFESLYFSFSKSNLNDWVEYAPSIILPMFILRCIKALIIAVVGLIALLLINKFIKHKIALYFCFIVTAFAIYVMFTDGPTPALFRFREVLSMAVLGYSIFYIFQNHKYHVAWLAAIGAVYSIFLAVGSTFSVQPAVYGLCFPLSFCILSMLGKPRTAGGDTVLSNRLYGPLMASLIALFLFVFIGPRGITWKALDMPNLFSEKKTYTSTQLAGFLDKPKTVATIDLLLAKIKRNTAPGDFCLFYNHSGLLYALSETRPCFTSPVLYHGRNGVVQAQIEKMMKDGIKPQMCILYNTAKEGSKSWVEINRDLLYVKQTLTQNLGYKLNREINGFSIYYPP